MKTISLFVVALVMYISASKAAVSENLLKDNFIEAIQLCANGTQAEQNHCLKLVSESSDSGLHFVGSLNENLAKALADAIQGRNEPVYEITLASEMNVDIACFNLFCNRLFGLRSADANGLKIYCNRTLSSQINDTVKGSLFGRGIELRELQN